MSDLLKKYGVKAPEEQSTPSASSILDKYGVTPSPLGEPISKGPQADAAAEQPQFEMPSTMLNQGVSGSQAANAFKQGFSTSARLVDKLTPSNLPDSVPKPRPLQDIAPGLFPEKGYEPSSPAEHAIATVGGFADPVALGSMFVGGKAGEFAAEKLLGETMTEQQAAKIAAQRSFNSVAAQEAATSLYKTKILSNAVKSGVEFGTMQGTQEALEKADAGGSAGDVFVAGLKGAGKGLLLGGALGAGGAAFGERGLLSTGKKTAQTFEATSTPLSVELEQQLQNTTLEEAKLREEHHTLMRGQVPSDEAQEAVYGQLDRNESAKYHTEDAVAAQAGQHVATHEERLASLEPEIARHQSILESKQIPLSDATLNAMADRAANGSARIESHMAELNQLQTSPAPLEDRFFRQQQLQSAIENEHKTLAPIVDNLQNRARPAELEDLERSQQAVTQLKQAKQALSDSLQDRLDTLSDTLNDKLEALQTRRDKLLGKLEPQGYDPDLIDRNAVALRMNLEQQAKLTQQIQDMQYQGYKYSGKPPKDVFSMGPTYEELRDIAYEQAAKVRKAVQNGLIPAEMGDLLAQKEFDNAASKMGIGDHEFKPSKLDDWLNSTTRQVRVDKALGTRTGEVMEGIVSGQNLATNIKRQYLPQFSKIADNLNKMGISDNEITRMLQYVESSPGGVIFNPSAASGPKLTRPLYQGAMPSSEAMAQLSQARQLLDTLADNSEISKINGYVPLRELSTPIGEGKSAAGVTDLVAARIREKGELVEGFHDTNFRSLMGRYTNEVATNQAYQKPLENAIVEINKLNLMGEFKEAEKFKSLVVDKMGLNGYKDASAILGNGIMAKNKDLLQELALKQADPEGFLTEMAHEFRGSMHSALVSNNPASLLKHVIQPETILAAEIGPKWVAAGRSSLLTDRALRNELKPLLRLSASTDVSVLGDWLHNMPDSLGAKATRMMRGSFLLGDKAFNTVVQENRMVSMVGSYKQFMSNFEKGGGRALEGVVADLTTPERALIRRAAEVSPEDAAKQYALIRTRRSNFAFNFADKPQMLSKGLGQYIPFTTFSRNIANRIYEGYVEGGMVGGTAQLAKRIATPLAALAVFEAMTGRTIPGSQPVTSLEGLGNPTVVPALGEASQNLLKGNPGQALKQVGNLTPWGVKNRLEKQLADPDSKTFIFPKATPGNSWVQKIVKKVTD